MQGPKEGEGATATAALRAVLDTRGREEDVQQFLASHPWILLDCFAFPWAVRHCVPKFKFGNELVSDFLLVSGQSFRYEFILLELEPPMEPLFTQDGVIAKRLNQAMKQVADWNRWIGANGAFFRREVARALRADSQRDKEEGHFGQLEYGADQIDPEGQEGRQFPPANHPPRVEYKIIIGRRSTLSPEDNERRASICQLGGEAVEIVTYDRLLQATETPIQRKWNDAGDR